MALNGRYVSRVLAVVLALGGAFLSGKVALAEISRNKNPALALRGIADDPGALALLADSQLAAAKNKPQSAEQIKAIRGNALQSIAGEALTVRNLRILGSLADNDGQIDRARAYYTLADRITRRDFGTNFWFALDRAKSNDASGAIKAIDTALKTNLNSREALFPVLDQSLKSSDIRAAFVPHINDDNPWLLDFLIFSINQGKSQLEVAQSLLAASKMPTSGQFVDAYYSMLKKLVELGEFDAARRLALKLPGADASVQRSLAFSAASINEKLAPLTWRLSASPTIASNFIEDDGKFVLAFSADANQTGTIADKLAFADVGQHRMTIIYKVQRMSSDSDLSAQISCANSGQILKRTQLPMASSPTRVDIDFAVSTGCSPVAFSLNVTSGSLGAGVEGEVSSISLQSHP